ncbi:MAG: guanine deaminase [Pseudomonadota bacterium]
MTGALIITGQVLSFTASPFDEGPDAARLDEAVLVENGLIRAVGRLSDLREMARHAQIEHRDGQFISAGFVDAHAHYPQTAIIASWGKRLIDWLESYTFPEEMRFEDPIYAAKIAQRYLDLVISNGTTTVASFCTTHPTSVTAFFATAAERNMRVVGGKTCMDRNAPTALLDTAQRAYDDSKALLQRWHGRGRATYAITPRFSPTSSPDQLSALGALRAEHPDCLMQTHLSEQPEEVAWVKSLFPNARDYLDSYEAHGLLDARAVFGHAIHLTKRERARLRETGAALVHCPTSNSFIGSGLFDMAARAAEAQVIGLATDTGGGSSFSMLRTMAAAYEIAQLSGHALHPSQLWWLATAGSARALHLEHKIGNILPGHEADLIAIDPASVPAIRQRQEQAGDIWESVFPTIMMGDDRTIAQVWIAGQAQYP